MGCFELATVFSNFSFVTISFALCNLKQGTPIDFVIQALSTFFLYKRWIHRKSVYELLVMLCCKRREELEVLRMLVRATQNKERVRQTFMDYAEKRELVPVALLFLAAPELFLSSTSSSSIVTLYHVFNSLEKRTDIEEAMLLLVDALAIAGHKLVAYTRLQYPNAQAFESSYLDVAFLVREVARNKLGLSSPDDYLLSFFKPVRPEADQLIDIPEDVSILRWQDWQHKGDSKLLTALPIQLKRHDLDQGYINRVLPSLTTADADCLNNAIEKKLSTMPTLYCPLEDFIGTTKQRVKYPLQGFPFPISTSFKSSLRSLAYRASAKFGIDFRNTPTNSWRNKVMKPSRLNSLFSRVRLSRFSNIAKRLIK
ncbi:uncharacterized protein LOC141631839 [Silene latifolia]|uniref:uncharacterized protein LOC141631839 n=1 Tax=Silene latifolia TaxID=37657 RepID=UPI003D7751F6